MSSAQYRPGIRNGRVRSRTATRSAARTDAQVEKSNSRANSQEKSRVGIVGRNGLMVLTAIIVAGLVVGVGFVMALQTQQQIHKIGIGEARLKAQFHEISNRQRVEMLEQQRTFNQAEQMALVQPVGPAVPAGLDRFGAGMAPLEVFPAVTADRVETVGAPRPGGATRSVRSGDGDPGAVAGKAGAGKSGGATIDRAVPERRRQAVVRTASKAASTPRPALRKAGAGRSRLSTKIVGGRIAGSTPRETRRTSETRRASELGKGGRVGSREGR